MLDSARPGQILLLQAAGRTHPRADLPNKLPRRRNPHCLLEKVSIGTPLWVAAATFPGKYGPKQV